MKHENHRGDMWDNTSGIAQVSLDDHWVEDTFQFSARQGRHIPLPETRRHMRTSVSSRGLFFVGASCILFFLIVAVRLVFLQGYRGADNRALAVRNSQRIVPIPSERGVILDRNGIALTENIPKFILAMIPQDLPRSEADRRLVIDRLSAIIGSPSVEIEQLVNEYRTYRYESVLLKDNLDYETAIAIYLSLADLPGISVGRGSKRLYVHQSSSSTPSQALSLSHVIGYLGKLNVKELDALYADGYLPADDIGKTGLEKSYETALRGVYGRRLVEVDALGRVQHVLAEEAPHPGAHLTLSLDIRLQEALEKSMRAHLTKEKNRAAGIVTDVRTGEILAFVSIPSFDNNDFSGGITMASYTQYRDDIALPLFNRVISGTYPSGSSIKPAIAAIGLESGVITKETTVNSTGGISIGQWFFPDWLAGGHGITNVTKAIAQSVNTFFYYLGGGYGDRVGLGIEKMVDGLRGFGFARTLGIDIPGEVGGFLPSTAWKEEVKHEQWYIGDTYNVSIGQGDVLVTPLQINAMTMAIANGGTLYRPHLVASLTDPMTKQKTVLPKETVLTLPIGAGNLSIVRQGMRECVTYGSCRRLASLPFSSAGKTGTAQWNTGKANHAWFTSFAPYERPEIAITILVEEGVEGSAISAPIAYDFYKEWWKIRTE